MQMVETLSESSPKCGRDEVDAALSAKVEAFKGQVKSADNCTPRGVL